MFNMPKFIPGEPIHLCHV